MANFCTKCGTPVTGRFCVKCGTDISQSTTPAPLQPVQQNARTAAPEAAQSPVARPALATVPPPVTNKKMSMLAKLGIAAVVVVFAGGALAVGGLYYAVHRVSQKIHEEAGSILGPSPSTSSPDSLSSGTGSGKVGIDVCRLLSKEDVGRAVGIVIARAQPEDNSCSYIANGDKADMLAKHATAMMAARGADKQTQQTIQKFAGGMFKEFQSEKPASEQDNSGEVPVLSFSVDQNAAEEQMRLNAKVLGVIGDQQSLPGIGDQAFVSADGMIMMRKGKNFVRILFIACPCNTDAVKPLAKEIADAL
jgi:hypothetical protein